MARILLTGAAGDIGARLRKILKPVYPDLRLSDWFFERDSYAGVPAGTLVVRPRRGSGR